MYKLNTTELTALLCTTKSTLKKEKSTGNLDRFANSRGYSIISENKEGRTVYYTVSDYNQIEHNPVLYLKLVYGIEQDNVDTFADFFYWITNIVQSYTAEQRVKKSFNAYAEILGVSKKTLYNWYEKLLVLGIITDNDYVYIEHGYIEQVRPNDQYLVDRTEVYKFCNELTYKKYWVYYHVIQEHKTIRERFELGAVNSTYYSKHDMLYYNACNYFKNRIYCYKIRDYIVNRDYFLFRDTIRALTVLYNF